MEWKWKLILGYLPDRGALSPDEFSKGARDDLVRASAGGSDYVISRLGYADFDRPSPRPPREEGLRPLNDEVNTKALSSPEFW